MVDFTTVVGNTTPSLILTLERDDTVIDLTNVTEVRLIIKNKRDDSISANSICSINTPPTDGKITYVPASTDFPNEGYYVADVRLRYNSGKIETLFEYVTFFARAAVS